VVQGQHRVKVRPYFKNKLKHKGLGGKGGSSGTVLTSKFKGPNSNSSMDTHTHTHSHTHTKSGYYSTVLYKI
jgi:hypothetical protein